MQDKLYKNPYEKIKVPRFAEADGFYTTANRSKNMSKIRAKNSKPELMFRKALWKNNIRYRLHPKNLPGKPDIILAKYKLAIFVDGVFWHGYQWNSRKTQIKTNRKFWIPKIERNMQRDREVKEGLESAGYTVMRFWEHEIKHNLQACVNQVELYIETAKAVKIPSAE